MAGDLDIPEAIAHQSTGFASPQPVMHEYGAVKIALGSSPALSPMPETGLDQTSALGLSAFKLRESALFKEAKALRNRQALSWGGDGINAALEPPTVEPPESSQMGSANAPDSMDPTFQAPVARLSGRIGVGVIIVSGPGPFAFNGQDQTKVVAEIQNGLSWLASQSPARDVTFVHDIHPVTVSAADNPQGGSYEACERAWRDEALAKLGHATGNAGIRSFIAAVRNKTGAPYAYCAFFTKYTLHHFAYAQPGSTPHLMMNFGNDGWGPDNIDRVFAHESCHIFGAPDEYAVAQCNCGGSWGYYGVPNINCETCAPSGGVDCLMRANTWAMCRATPYHVGFKGLPPFAAGAPTV